VSATRPVTRQVARSSARGGLRAYGGAAPITASVTIAAAGDDGHETAGTTWVTAGAFGGVGIMGYNFFVNATSCRAAFSFDLAGAIPQGSVLASATLTVTVITAPGAGTLTFNVFGQDADAAAQPAAGNRPSSWAKTTATINRTDAPSGATPIDVTAIVQEIIDRPLWDGNRINLFSESNIFTGQNNWAVALFENAGANPNLTVVTV